MKKCINAIENMPLQRSSIYSCPWQVSQSAFFSSKTLCVIIFWQETACVSKARLWPRGWQMPGPRAVQNLQLPHPRDWQGGQMPRCSPGAAGRSWNWLMHEDLECISYFLKGLCRKAGSNTEWLYHIFSTKEHHASYRLWDVTLC